MKKKSIFAFVIYAVVIIAVISLLASSMNSANSQQKEISIEELWTKIENGEIYSAYYNRNDGSILAVEKSDNADMDADKTDKISNRYDFRADYINTDEAIKEFQDIARANGVKYGFVPVAQTSIFELAAALSYNAGYIRRYNVFYLSADSGRQQQGGAVQPSQCPHVF